MKGQEPEPPTSGAQAEEAPEQEPAPTSADIMIFCHPRNVENLVHSFENEITHADGALPLFVLWSGTSGVLHQGVIVLEWEGKVNPAFLHNLKTDHEIFDFVIYDWVRNDGKEEQTGTPAKASDEGKEGLPV